MNISETDREIGQLLEQWLARAKEAVQLLNLKEQEAHKGSDWVNAEHLIPSLEVVKLMVFMESLISGSAVIKERGMIAQRTLALATLMLMESNKKPEPPLLAAMTLIATGDMAKFAVAEVDREWEKWKP